jgi:hypothetical protein
LLEQLTVGDGAAGEAVSHRDGLGVDEAVRPS